MARKRCWRQRIWKVWWTFKIGPPPDPDSYWRGPCCKQAFAETVYSEKRVYINPKRLGKHKYVDTPAAELVNTLAHELWHITDDDMSRGAIDGGIPWKPLEHQVIYDLARVTGDYVTSRLVRAGVLPPAT